MALTRQHGLGPTRARVLTLLQGSVEPVSVVQVATELDMHKNSARFHLDGLVESGYADRVVATPHAPGRPPLVYAATSTSPTMSNIHLLELIGVLLDEVQSRGADAEADCLQAGRRWGARMAEPDTSAERVPEELAEHLTQRGFGVQRDADDLRFIRCPFRGALAPDAMPLVCAIHQGLLDGYLDASTGDLSVGPLQIGPVECVARLRRPTPDEPA